MTDEHTVSSQSSMQ